MRRLVLVVWAFFFSVSSVFAAAIPAYSGRMNDAVAAVVAKKAQQRGFAANDPRFGATMAGLGSAATTVAVGVGTAVAAGTAVAWLPLLAAAGLAAVVGGGVSLAADGLYQWLFNSDGSVSTQDSGSLAALSVGALSFTSANCGGNGGPVWASSVDGVGAGCAALSYAAWGGDPSAPVYSVISCDAGSCLIRRQPSIYSSEPFDFTVLVSSGTSSYECASGVHGPAGCMAVAGGGAPAISNASPTDAISNIPDAELSKPLNPVLLAEAANRLWQQAAAQPGYAGLPYDLYNPVTASDAATWAAENPAFAPTVGDAIAPVASGATAPLPQGVSVPIPSASGTAVNPVTNPGINPSSQPLSNLGADPGIGTPTLESTPTASAILAPVLGLMPSLRNFVVPSHSAVCPAPSGDFFGTAFVLDGHCSLLEDVRPTLSLVMAAVWLMVSTLVVLRA